MSCALKATGNLLAAFQNAGKEQYVEVEAEAGHGSTIVFKFGN